MALTVKNTGEGADEVITVYHYFIQDGAGGYALNAIEFADGTNWDVARIKTLVQAGTASANAPSHSHSHKSRNGLGGIDTLYSYVGNDTLHGGAGIHSLYEGRSNSTRRGVAAAQGDRHGGAGRDTPLHSTRAESVVLANNQLDKLVNAMAGYSAPGGVGNVAPQTVQDEWQAVITTAWQAA